jgi:hypothetical protein
MTSGEVNALNELAKAHGGHLTINPKTGLAEAGFLSSILPTVAGIALGSVTGDPFLAAALVGGADAMITGSLGQGLMAGLGAWSGAGLQSDLAKLATTQSVTDASLSGVGASNVVSNAVANTNIGSSLMGTSNIADTTGGLANIGEVGTQAAGPVIPGAINPTGTISAQDIYNANTAQQASNLASQIAPNTATSPTGLDASWQGAQKLMNDPSSRMPFWQANKWDVVGVGMPVVKGIMQEMQPNPYVAPTAQKNPFNLKTLDPNFQGSFPTQPNPYHQAQYRDYTTNPYTSYSAGGGLQSVDKYAGATNSVTSIGNKLLGIQNPTPAPIGLSDPNAIYDPTYYEGTTGVSANKYGKEYDTMSSDKLAQHILDSAKSLGKIASKPSVMMQDPAQTSMASIQSETPATTVKEGGLMGYAGGGLGTLGGYSDGGRLLKGPGDGVSDSIPASIGNKQPARLAEGEFVIPARIVSELGNGSTDAGAKRLYAMMDRIKAKRASAKNIAADTKTYNLLPA